MTDSSKMRRLRMEKVVTVLETIASRLTVAEQFTEADHELLVQVDAACTGIGTDVESIERKVDKLIELLTKHMTDFDDYKTNTNDRLKELERQRKVPSPHPATAGG